MLSKKFDPIVEIVQPNRTMSGGIVVLNMSFLEGEEGQRGRRWVKDQLLR
jgi:hypothetical protein